MRFLLFLFFVLAIVSCQESNPQRIIDKAIVAAGGEKYQHSTIEFDFRGRHYKAIREGGKFSYERIFTNDKDATQIIHDFVTNESFERKINDSTITLPDSMKVKYTASTNSVIYFALLPYALNDPSVKKKFLGQTEIDGKSFYKIEVTFSSEGGGEDYEDVFNYWINTKDFTIGFLSYSYKEGNEIGYRLRKAYNPQKVNGILFFDYINYAPMGNEKLEELEALYKNNKLKELSKIENTNIEVK
jgi:hypothetical protein